MPVAVMLDCEAQPAVLWVVNDTLRDLGPCSVEWSIRSAQGSSDRSGSVAVQVGPDARVSASTLELPATLGEYSEIVLVLRGPDSAELARNVYPGPLHHPPHPEGHPQRMDHELGMRLYWGEP